MWNCIICQHQTLRKTKKLEIKTFRKNKKRTSRETKSELGRISAKIFSCIIFSVSLKVRSVVFFIFVFNLHKLSTYSSKSDRLLTPRHNSKDNKRKCDLSRNFFFPPFSLIWNVCKHRKLCNFFSAKKAPSIATKKVCQVI